MSFKILSSLFFVLNCINAQEKSITTIKSRIYDSIINDYFVTPSNSESKDFDQEIQTILSNFDGEKWSYIQYNDVSREGFDNRIHLNNLILMAVAYKSSHSKYYLNKTLLKKIKDGLRFWCDNDFIGENWWNNQIGTPKSLVELMLVIGQELPKKLIIESQKIVKRANIYKGGSRPGGDRIKVSSIAAKNQLFLDNLNQFKLIVNIIENEIKFVDWIGDRYGYTFSKSDTGGFNEFLNANGRGLQYDYSFHHRTDGVNNTLSYGLGWAMAFVEWAYYLRDTEYAFSTIKTNILVDYYLDGVCKTSVFGVKPDYGAKNRSISRPGTTKAFDNRIPLKLLELTDYRNEEISEIISLRSGKKEKKPVSHSTFYWNSEHFTFQRPEFFSSVRLYSSRNMNMESPYNSEGLLNHHRGDGANHIYTHGNEYDDISPVLDYQRITGTTVVQKEELPHHDQIKKLGLTDFVGAATDGQYGLVGFDFKSVHDPLVARKSWFFFDEQYVCLGSGISSKSKTEVNTTLNQCLLNGDVNLSFQGKQRKLEKGTRMYPDVDWIHHDNIGYFLLKPQEIWLMNQQTGGSWWRISKQIDSSKEIIIKDVFKTWINHGHSPDNATYEYIIRPNTDLEEMNEVAGLNPVVILSNTPYLQAVANKSLNLIQAVFYKAGRLLIGEDFSINTSAPCILMIQMNKNNHIKKITVSDPNRELNNLLLKVSKKFNNKGDHFISRWISDQGISEIIIDLPKGTNLGRSIVVQ